MFPVCNFEMQKTSSAIEWFHQGWTYTLKQDNGNTEGGFPAKRQLYSLITQWPGLLCSLVDLAACCPQSGYGSPVTKCVFYFSSPFFLHCHWSKLSSFSSPLSNPLFHFNPEIKNSGKKAENIKQIKPMLATLGSCLSYSRISLKVSRASEVCPGSRAWQGWAARRRLTCHHLLFLWDGAARAREWWDELLSRRKIREDKGRTRIKSPWKRKTLISSSSVLHPLESVLQWKKKITTILNTIS